MDDIEQSADACTAQSFCSVAICHPVVCDRIAGQWLRDSVAFLYCCFFIPMYAQYN